MMAIEGADFYVRLIDLPYGVGGFVAPNEDGTFNVYLNARLSAEKNLDTFLHEVEHIENDDFYNGLPLQVIEERARLLSR